MEQIQSGQKNQNQFLETEGVGTLMRKYALPCIISLLVAALYNIVDQIFIANASYLGSAGNAANTVVFPLTIVALAVAVMIGDGTCAFVSISLGRKDGEKAHRAVGNAIVICIAASLAITAVYLIFQDGIITFFGGRVNGETFRNAKEYFFWITAGIPFYMFGQAMNPVIRLDGSPKFAMFSTVSGAIVNIILDPVFIFVCKWGMMGAAVATVLGQILTALLALGYLCRMKTVRLCARSFVLSPGIARRFLALGVTSFLAQIPLAVLGIVMKFFQIVISIAVGCAAGCIPVAGYNIGAGRKDRAKQLFTYLLLTEAAVGATHEHPYYTAFAVKSFRVYLCMTVLATVNKGTFIYLQAMGKAAASTLISLTRELIFGVGFALLLPAFWGLDGLLVSFPLSDFLTFIIAAVIIRRTYKELSE